MRNIEPTRGNVLIRTITPDKEESTNSGIILSTQEESGDLSDSGTIISIGDLMITDDGTEMPVNYGVGDTVRYFSYAGKVMYKDDVGVSPREEYIIMNMAEILGKEVE